MQAAIASQLIQFSCWFSSCVEGCSSCRLEARRPGKQELILAGLAAWSSSWLFSGREKRFEGGGVCRRRQGLSGDPLCCMGRSASGSNKTRSINWECVCTDDLVLWVCFWYCGCAYTLSGFIILIVLEFRSNFQNLTINNFYNIYFRNIYVQINLFFSKDVHPHF